MKNHQDLNNNTVRRVRVKTNRANGWSSNLLHGSTVLHTSTETHEKDVVLVAAAAVDNENEELVRQRGHGGGGRERLKRHREEVAGRVLIPDKWGQEDLLKDWIDCSAFEAFLVPNKIASARNALVAAGTSTSSTSHQQPRIESRC